MHPLRSVTAYFGFVFVGGALLAPILHHWAQIAASWNPWFTRLSEYPFHRFVNRSLLIAALAGLWPFLKSLNIRWRELGLSARRTEWQKFAAGLLIGLVSLALVATIALLVGVRTLRIDHSATEFVAFVGKAVSAAVVVALLEELLFRGVLFSAIRKAHGWIVALILSSSLFALLHFFERKVPETQTIEWFSGFVTLAQMLRGFVDLNQLVPGFVNLFVVGALLAFAYQRTGSLSFSIGLHAGWIFWVKSYSFLTRPLSREVSWFWGTGKLINGWLAFLVLIALFGILLRWKRLFAHANKPA